ncbi:MULTISPECIES: tRNA pseudouridine(55) synthase TruB [Myroides]|uniref:tRNA pseudouridine synthase B n=1 Tax=Myroides albus TaxID=2562892 RepID=A0A6I3LBN1_9FLAO|nr:MULTISPECIES: tRNA pseudouridine(55) synthase TruB [Myroides]MTG96859.1 tRNA pseudouridine(55) synthase TruB [Myroides albus]MVX36964.1 tRNA pseudouridine(55) synthase TruB [Myroides sp. LoEW2-1]UVD78391.1 tRNA pseudouridine(55) synthase TruB [Myroides albus]
MINYSAEAFQQGQILLIDKPLHWSSFQAVNKIKWLLKKELGLKKIKVGHAGTLDPLASGLLIICTGKSTKQISELQGQIKEYTGTIQVGATTPSYDLETEIDQTYPIEHITENLLEEVRLQFIGNLEQRPPIFSAIKKDGKRLYEHARKGEEVEINTRPITIYGCEFTQVSLPNIDFKVTCSKGTYIRSLAYDIGLALKSGGHLTSLRRTKIGDYTIENALSLEEFETNIKAQASTEEA